MRLPPFVLRYSCVNLTPALPRLSMVPGNEDSLTLKAEMLGYSSCIQPETGISVNSISSESSYSFSQNLRFSSYRNIRR